MHLSSNNRLILGSIIGLKKESEEQCIALHNHTFPEVLDRIHQSNISDYSIFLHDGILFSHMVYSGINYESDMKAMDSDKSTLEWWKLTDAMQQPLDYRKNNEWWAEITLWYSHELPNQAAEKVLRHAYRFSASSDLEETVPENHFGDIDFWGTTYGLNTLRIFKGVHEVYVYLETAKDSDHSFLLNIIARVLKTDKAAIAMTEVFHTEKNNSIQAALVNSKRNVAM